MISFISIFTNSGLIAFTSDIFDSNNRIIVFIILSLIFLVVKFLIKFVVPDSPHVVKILMKRH